MTENGGGDHPVPTPRSNRDRIEAIDERLRNLEARVHGPFARLEPRPWDAYDRRFGPDGLRPDGGREGSGSERSTPVVTSEDMARVTARIPPAVVRDMERLVEEGYYDNRSGVVRDACRRLVIAWGGENHNINVGPQGPEPGHGTLLTQTDGGNGRSRDTASSREDAP